MTTNIEALVASPVLKAAAATAATFGPPAAKKGDARLTGDARRKVLVSAIAVMSVEEQAALTALSDEEIHRWLSSVLDHAGCLLAKAPGYLGVVKGIGFSHSAESVIGPKGIRNVVANLAKQREKAAKAEQPKAEKTQAVVIEDEPVVITAPKAEKPAKRTPPVKKSAKK